MSIDNSARSNYRFGEFSLDLERQTLARGDREIHLRPKSIAVLMILLEHPGRLVPKEVLCNAAWKDTAVSDESLAHCIADIRRALGDDEFEMIRTVPRRGYIFELPVTEEFFVQPGLSNKRRLTALPAASLALAMLGITVLLVVAGFGDTGAGRDDASAKRPPFQAGAGPLRRNAPANSAYQRGRFYFDRRSSGDLDRAEESFKKALELDPSFGAAWAGLAGIYSVRYGDGDAGRNDVLPLLGDATRRAVSLAPENAESHIRRAYYHRMVSERMDAQRHYDIAMTLAPDDPLVLSVQAGELAKHGHLYEAIALQEQALAGDPTSVVLYNNLVSYLLAAGRVEEAAVQAEHYRALAPANFIEDADLFVDILILQGKHEQALLLAHEIVSEPKRYRSLAIIYEKLGHSELAEIVLKRLRRNENELTRFHVAEVLAQRGETEFAMQLLSDIITAPVSATAKCAIFDLRALSLLSPHLRELRSTAHWQDLYAQVLDTYEGQRFFASASVPPATRTR